MMSRNLWVALMGLAACAEPSATDADDGGLSACQTDLEASQGALGDAELLLQSAESDLTTCESDLAAAEADLATCESDLAACNPDPSTCATDLATCTSDLTAAEASLATCESDLTAAQSDLTVAETDLTACEADLTASEEALGTAEALVTTLTDELDALVPVRDEDLTALLAANELGAWTGRSLQGGWELEHQFFFLNDGTAFWGERPTGGTTGPGSWYVGTWTVDANEVTVSLGAGSATMIHMAGKLHMLTDHGSAALTHQTYDTLTIMTAADATRVGTWTACADASPYDGCLADDGSGGTTAMSLEWSYTSNGSFSHVFSEGLYASGGASNAAFSTSAGTTTVNQSTAGATWIKLAAPTQVAGTHAVTLDNAGANGVVMGGSVVVIEADWNFYP